MVLSGVTWCRMLSGVMIGVTLCMTLRGVTWCRMLSDVIGAGC